MSIYFETEGVLNLIGYSNVVDPNIQASNGGYTRSMMPLWFTYCEVTFATADDSFYLSRRLELLCIFLDM